MYTQFQKILAAMAFDAYRPSGENRIELVAIGWVPDVELSRDNRGSGFDATVYVASANEVVVSFRGTDPGFIDWLEGNIPAGKGIWSEQIARAIETVADVMAKYPAAEITFTGHSLGGGLASVMAVFFDRPAYIFAPAPFEYSATDTEAEINLVGGITLTNSDLIDDYFTHYREYQISQGRRFDINEAFRNYAHTFTESLTAGRALFAERERSVDGTFIRGEILEFTARLLVENAVDPDEFVPIEIGQTSLSNASEATTFRLHSMLLHAALVTSDKLVQASTRLPPLLELFGDSSLFAQPKSSPTPGFLNRIVEQSITDLSGANQLDRFADELLRLGTAGSTHLSGIEEGLIAAVMERYHEQDGANIPQFVEQVTNAVRIDVSLLSGGDNHNGLDRLIEGIQSLPIVDADKLSADVVARRSEIWTVQSGSIGLSTAGLDDDEVQIGSSISSNFLIGGLGSDLLIGGILGDGLQGGVGEDVLLGGGGVDQLSGGDEADYLSGGSDGDVLDGGGGSDTLVGGTGADQYRFASTDGSDTISDSDGGELFIDGQSLSGLTFTRIAQHAWSATTVASGVIYAGVGYDNVSGSYSVVIRNQSNTLRITIQDWALGNSFGLAIDPNASWTEAGTNTAIREHEQDGDPVDFWRLSATAAVGAPAPFFVGTGANEFIAGTDKTNASGTGGDFIDGGDGDDFIAGGQGADVLLGGAGNDWIRGSLGAGYFEGQNEDLEFPLLLSAQGWGLCAEPPICAMCECSNHLALCADLPMQVSHVHERLLDS